MRVQVVEQDLVTAWGRGVDSCWNGVLSGKPAFSEVKRFGTAAFQAHLAAFVPGLEAGAADSLVMQMLKPLFVPLSGRLPEQTLVILASTTGEVDLLERHLLGGSESAEASRLNVLLARIMTALGVGESGMLVSSACASSSAAVAHGAALIASGARECVLVVACDAVTEFVFAGFSSLMALDPDGARPFDKTRKGLTIGEAAGFVLLMSEERARREGRTALGEVAGWGLSCDANHMTGPTRDGDGLARAIRQAFRKADLECGRVGSISAHGTGTVYNDSMELKAYRQVFGISAPPVYSIKGSVGHTMGAAGLVEMIMALQSLRTGVIPPSSHLCEVDPEACGWVSPEAIKAPGMRAVLSTNSGFGGVNAALLVQS
jgi:3-oxoacyl-[acyl-carrier-protein] synthase II